MKLNELLNIINDVYKNYNTSVPFLCGGVCRDKYLKRLDNIEDLDITTGDKTIKVLSAGLNDFLKDKYKIVYKEMDDGHSSIFIGGMKLDFSSNFIIPDINIHLNKLGIASPTSLEQEMYSRDFTCNSLLIDTNLTKIFSPVKNAIDDLNNKIIKTCLEPVITLTTNKNRVVRAIYLSSKLNFKISDDIISFVKKHPESINISSNKTLIKKLNSAFEYNPELAVENISKMDLWKHIPITDIMTPYYAKHVGRIGIV